MNTIPTIQSPSRRLLSILSAAMLLAVPLACASTDITAAPQATRSIPFDQLGAEAQKQYQGDGIGITSTAGGAILRTGFQKLSGTVNRRGLRLDSTAAEGGSLNLTAISIGRDRALHPTSVIDLPSTGAVTVTNTLVTYTRPGLTEEYSVSVDGVRQDFLVEQRPAGSGALSVELALKGAKAEAAADGATLVLDGSQRALIYNRLHVTDASNKQLTAHMEVMSTDRLRIVVDDTAAQYPVRIDPTFSDADWISISSGIPGANQRISALAVDGSGNLYAGGDFTLIGTQIANRIAKWDGSTWSALGSGINGSVQALVVVGSDLYVGGSFTAAGGVANTQGIAKWDGSAWSALGTGMDGAVQALAAGGGNLYAGGVFTTAGGGAASNIAKWNGTAWSALGTGTNGEVRALVVDGNGNLYAGGYFTDAGGTAANNVARWDGSTWSILGTGTDGRVNALAVLGAQLYAGGDFDFAGGVAAQRLAVWDGSTWSATAANSTTNAVQAILSVGAEMYVAYFNGLQRFDGTNWTWLNTSIAGTALAAIGGDIYLGGGFSRVDNAGNLPALSIVKWSMTTGTWQALGSGANDWVWSFAVIGTDLYVGGSFASIGGVPNTRCIAKWNGTAWSAVGSGVNQAVGAMAVSGTDLYVGGSFSTAGGIPANGIAKWNGSAWSALGSGLIGGVYSIATNGNDVYAGGTFWQAGGVSASRIAKWDGSVWSALGSGTSGGDNQVKSLLVDGNGILYAGGSFNSAGDALGTEGIAKWNGTAWSAVGGPLTGGWNVVDALEIDGSGNLYAGGDFTSAGGVPASRIAKWNGSVWSALGTGLNNNVYAITLRGADLYAGGDFTQAGGAPANYIAKWDGSAWSAMGSGTDGSVRALRFAGSRLCVGGYFYFAGTTVSPFIVQAGLSTPPVAVAGADQEAGELTTVTLDGTASSDIDNDPLSFAWVQLPGGPAVTLTGATTAQPTFTAPVVGPGGLTLTFQLTVTADGLQTVDTVEVRITNAKYYIGDTVNIDLGFVAVGVGQTMKVLGLPPGLQFVAGSPPRITGTALGLGTSTGVVIQVLQGKTVVQSQFFDLAIEPYRPAGNYEALLEDGGLPVGKLKITVASPSTKTPNPANRP